MGLISRVSSRTYREVSHTCNSIYTYTTMNKAPKMLVDMFVVPHMKAFNAVAPHLRRHAKYAKVELMPAPAALPAGLAGIMANTAGVVSGQFLGWTVKEAVINLLICAEISCWFFVGECWQGRSRRLRYQIFEGVQRR